MSSVVEIERAVAQLAPQELAEFRAWFDQFEADRFDRRIETDALAGRLDRLAAETLSELRAGAVRDL